MKASRHDLSIQNPKIMRLINGAVASSYPNSINWAKTLKEAYHLDSFLFLLEEDEKPILGCVATRPSNIFGRHKFYSPAFADHGGILIFDKGLSQKREKKLAQLLKDLFKEVSFIQLRTLEKPLINSSETTFFNFKLALQPCCHDQWSSVNQKVRNQVRKAEKHGLYSSIHQKIPPEFLDLYFDKMQQFGTPAHSKNFFKRLMHNFDRDIFCVCIKNDQKITYAAALIIFFNNECYVPFAASNFKERHNNSNMLLYWELIKFAINRQAKTFVFGRSSPHSGTYKFKAQWGGDIIPLYYENVKNGDIHQSSSGHLYHSSMFSFFSKLWRLMPSILTTRFGFLLRIFLP